MSLENQSFRPHSDKSDNTRHSEFVGSRKSDRHGQRSIELSDVRSGQNSSDGKPGQKLCKACKNSKRLADFPRHYGSRDGRRRVCRDCLLAGAYQPRIEPPGQRARRAVRERKPKWQRSHRRALARYVQRNPLAVAASRALKAAVSAARVTKAEHCQVHGCTSRKCLEAHHWCYARQNWLEVLWCCAAHHRQGHARGFIIPAEGIPSHYGTIPEMLEIEA